MGWDQQEVAGQRRQYKQLQQLSHSSHSNLCESAQSISFSIVILRKKKRPMMCKWVLIYANATVPIAWHFRQLGISVVPGLPLH
jgi:hypothetical protein